MASTSKPSMIAKGLQGARIELYSNRIKICREGADSFFLGLPTGEKEILISQISSIQFKNPGFLVGHIQFSFLGGQESKGGMMSPVKDENTVTFNKKQLPEFEELKKRIDSIRDAGVSAQEVRFPELDEIEKLASLRDRGIITGEEFDLKKKQMLGL